jgi:hypothetical protein
MDEKEDERQERRDVQLAVVPRRHEPRDVPGGRVGESADERAEEAEADRPAQEQEVNSPARTTWIMNPHVIAASVGITARRRKVG